MLLRKEPVLRVKRHRLKMAWTCSDHTQHEHRWYWTAAWCGRVQRFLGWLRTKVASKKLPGRVCGFCKYYDFNPGPGGEYTGKGWCIKLRMKKDPGDSRECKDFYCSRIGLIYVDSDEEEKDAV